MPDFVPDLSVILAFAVASFILTITPGPDMALQLSRAINYGRAHGFATVAGAVVGLLAHTSLAALGISILIVAAPAAFMALKIVGAIYLLWLAWQAIRSGGGLRIAGPAKRAPTLKESFATAVGINLLNPKVVLFFVTFLPQFVTAGDADAPGKLFFLGGEFIVVSMPFTIAMIYGAEWLAKAFTRSKWVERALNWSFAGVFTAFAATIILAEGKR
jgi:threonine/homoserine/homoserine lactone efflux protein